MLWVALCLSQLSLWAQSTSLPQPEIINDRQGLPQGFVPGLVQDRQGFIWMATRDGLCRYDGNQFKVFRPRPDDPTALSFSDLQSLQLDHRGRIWIISEQGNIVQLDPRTETFTNVSQHIFPHQSGDKIHIQQCFPDRQDRLWLAVNGQGLLCFSVPTGQLRRFRHQPDEPHSLASDSVRHILEDKNGTIWVATAAGLDQFQPQTGSFAHYRPQSPTPMALPELNLNALYLLASGEMLIGSTNYLTRVSPRTGQVHALYRLSRNGAPIVWGMRFATDSRGTVYFDHRDRLFRLRDKTDPQFLTDLTAQTGYCASLLIDRSDVLWIGTNGLGVRKYDLHSDGFRTARYQINFHTDLLTQWLGVPASRVRPFLKDNDLYHFRYTLDKQGALWANVGSSVFYHINLRTRQTEKIDFPVPFRHSICPLSTDGQGKVWANYEGQLWWYNPSQHQWARSAYQYELARTGSVVQLVADDQAFWLASQAQGLFRLDRRTGKLRQYTYQPNQPTTLSNNALFCLSADPQDANRLWIGTFGSGLCAFDKRSGQCRRITEQQGLPNNVIYSALPDQYGNLWVGTNKGLCRLNRTSFAIRVYTTEDGLLANEFNRFHYVCLASGQIIMGGVEGFTSFQPAQLQDDTFQPKVELTELQINNRVVNPSPPGPLGQPIQAVGQLRLPYHQNFLTVQFAALQYNRKGKNRYRYQLEGIDPDWVENNQAQAVYTALAPGQYTLLVNASNTSGRWSRYIRKLDIVIIPPWWRTWWAYLLYVLVVGGSLWYWLRLHLNRLHLQQEARQLRELDAMKSRFFTNVTHDFRTPLTLILSPMDGLIQDMTGTRYAKRLESIHRNARQLLGLINQLLDFSKLDAKALVVQEARGDVGQFVGQTLQLFEQEAAQKAVGLTYQNQVVGAYWFDADKLERILSNLIGNALKFTPTGGHITVSLRATNAIELVVTDTGVGISAEKLPYVFDRFFQGSAHAWSATAVEGAQAADPAVATPQPTGTGIGLALVQELVQLQSGQIDVASQPGQGTAFRVRLPYRPAHETIPAPANAVVAPPATVQPGVATESSGEQPHLLLVEDNAELADFIADSLPAHYRISRATQGAQGLEQVLAELPDLVISDVMMPIMDGYTLCQHLKADERTNHIPVILLTAKSALESRIEGLERGADEYLTKPFHVQELNLRIHNLLERQHRLRERIQQELSRPDSSPPETSPAPPNPFLEKLYGILEAKLDDSAFSVEDLADQVAMSRVHLHRKLKALSGLPAGDVIRNYRLKRATQFLREGLNSSETAYRVGFDSPAYFTKCFREVYGQTPLDFAQRG